MSATQILCSSDNSVDSHIAAKIEVLQRGVPYISVINLVDSSCQEGLRAHAGVTVSVHLAADALIAVSEANLHTLRSLYGLPNDRGEVIYNPCPERFFGSVNPIARQNFRDAHGVTTHDIIC